MQYLTKGKLNRMLKYFRNKRISYRYEYNNSLGGHIIRQGCVTYDSFEIRGSRPYFHVVLTRGGVNVFEQEFDNDWYFTGVGKLEMINSGPRCHFQMELADLTN